MPDHLHNPAAIRHTPGTAGRRSGTAFRPYRSPLTVPFEASIREEALVRCGMGLAVGAGPPDRAHG